MSTAAPTDVTALLDQAGQAYAESNWQLGREAAEKAWLELKSQQQPTAGEDAAPQADLLRRAGLLLCNGSYRTGALSAMLETALDIAPLVRAVGPTVEIIDFLRMVALAAADTHRFELALSYAQEAMKLAQGLSAEEGALAHRSLTTNALACFFERCGNPWQAERLMHQALSLAQRQSQRHPVFVATNNLSGVLIGRFYLMRDAVSPEEALEPLQQALPHAQAAVAMALEHVDPMQEVFTRGNLGEILVHLGHGEEAQAELDTALELAHSHGFDAQTLRLRCSLGELMLSRGQTQASLKLLGQVLKAPTTLEHPTVRMRAHHAMWRACAALRRHAQALRHLQSYLQMERGRATRQLGAQAELFVTRLEAEQAQLDARRHRQKVQQLEADVRLDLLTGLGNRRELEATLPTLVLHAQIEGTALAVAMLDLDLFKQVNDRFGHAVGDRVLSTLGQLLRAHTRTADLLVRMGGEEFLLAMPDTERSQALEVCERIRQRIAEHPWALFAPGLQVTLSLGIACSPGIEAVELVQRADQALYQAKNSGRNSLVCA